MKQKRKKLKTHFNNNKKHNVMSHLYIHLIIDGVTQQIQQYIVQAIKQKHFQHCLMQNTNKYSTLIDTLITSNS